MVIIVSFHRYNSCVGNGNLKLMNRKWKLLCITGLELKDQNCKGNWIEKKMKLKSASITWWCLDMETISTLLAFYEVIHQSLVDSPQRASNAEHWYFLCCYNTLFNSWVGSDLRYHDANQTSLWWEVVMLSAAAVWCWITVQYITPRILHVICTLLCFVIVRCQAKATQFPLRGFGLAPNCNKLRCNAKSSQFPLCGFGFSLNRKRIFKQKKKPSSYSHWK